MMVLRVLELLVEHFFYVSVKETRLFSGKL